MNQWMYPHRSQTMHVAWRPVSHSTSKNADTAPCRLAVCRQNLV